MKKTMTKEDIERLKTKKTKSTEQPLEIFEPQTEDEAQGFVVKYEDLSTPLKAFVFFGWVTIVATLVPLVLLLLMFVFEMALFFFLRSYI